MFGDIGVGLFRKAGEFSKIPPGPARKYLPVLLYTFTFFSKV
jgi:hypothetical protein